MRLFREVAAAQQHLIRCITLRIRVRQKMHSVVSLKNCMAMYLDFEKTFGLLVAVFSFAAFAYIK